MSEEDYQQICRALGWLNNPPLEVIIKDIRARAEGARASAIALGVLYARWYTDSEIRDNKEAMAMELAKIQYDTLKARGEL